MWRSCTQGASSTSRENRFEAAGPLWVSSTADNCLGSECPYWSECHLVKARQEAQSADIVAKRIDGAVQKYLKEVSLADQVFVKAADGKQTVAQMLKAANTNVKGFTLYVVGEGIEKKADDFAAEVAAQVAAAKAAAA